MTTGPTIGYEERAARVRALGNAVCWPQGFAAVRLALALLDGADTDAAWGAAMDHIGAAPARRTA